MSNNTAALPSNTSVIICCAGMGTRLGIGTTKSLINICGKPLIIRQLELLDDYDDIRIVVGYDAERLIDTVNSYRKDIMYAFNYDYAHNGPGDSLKKGMLGSREYVITLDGDTVQDPDSFKSFLSYPGECIAVNKNASVDTIRATIENDQVTQFSNSDGNMQWSGMAKVNSNELNGKSHHSYEMLNAILPIKAFYANLKEINTPDDYEMAIHWFENGMPK